MTATDQRAGNTSWSRSMRRRQTRTALGFSAPFLILFTAFILAPMCYAVYQSLFDVRRNGLGFGPSVTRFVGLHNYLVVWRDELFRESVIRVLVLGITTVTIMLALATLLALLLDSGLVRAVAFFRISYFVPYAVPGVLAVLLWTYMYVPQFSPINSVLSGLGFHGVNLLSPGAILASIGNIVIWEFVGYNMLIVFTALQAVPRELSEAARVDGAKNRQIAWHIKLPLVRPAIVLAALFSIVGMLQLFTEPVVLQSVAPGAISPEYTPILDTYSTTFNAGRPNLGAAQAVVIAILCAVLSVVFLRLSTRGSAR